jgi:hypothetical protein
MNKRESEFYGNVPGYSIKQTSRADQVGQTEGSPPASPEYFSKK